MTHYVHTWYLSVVRPSTLFKIKVSKLILTAGETVGLAEWIINDTCLVLFIIILPTNWCFSNIGKYYIILLRPYVTAKKDLSWYCSIRFYANN